MIIFFKFVILDKVLCKLYLILGGIVSSNFFVEDLISGSVESKIRRVMRKEVRGF